MVAVDLRIWQQCAIQRAIAYVHVQHPDGSD
jgi:hypothetical protein